VVASAALAAQGAELLPSLRGCALGALANPLDREAAAAGDASRGLGVEGESFEIAFAGLLDISLGALALVAAQAFEAVALDAGAMGVVGWVARGLE
jgi:hypothetical protein